MGATLQWRSIPERTAKSYGKTITFGNLRDRGTAYMSYSERVGPGVLVVHDEFGHAPWLEAFADELTEEGFTVLAPDLYVGDRPTSVEDAVDAATTLPRDPVANRLVRAAADHLTDNWHPRLGVVGFGAGADIAVALADERPLDAAALYYASSEVGATTPSIVHACSDVPEPADPNSEAIVYTASRHFANPMLNVYDPDADAAARAETIEFFRYHLS